MLFVQLPFLWLQISATDEVLPLIADLQRLQALCPHKLHRIRSYRQPLRHGPSCSHALRLDDINHTLHAFDRVPALLPIHGPHTRDHGGEEVIVVLVRWRRHLAVLSRKDLGAVVAGFENDGLNTELPDFLLEAFYIA